MALPLHNPDLFWHLSAGRWIAENGSIPRADPFSFTRGGEPWVDFEWAFQLFVYGLHQAGGLWLLRLAKAALLLAAWLPVDALLRRRGSSGAGRALASAFWAAAVLPQSDLRPDLLSALLFAVLLSRLDADRLSPPFALAFFALWANLHPGFALGLALYAAKALALLRERRPPPRALALEAGAAALGTLLNPLGAGVWGALGAHAVEGATIGRYVQEWGALSLRSALQWPFLAALLALAALAWSRRGRLPAFLALASLGLAVASLLSVRFGLFFAAAGAALWGAVEARPSPRLALGALAALTALLAWPLARMPWTRPISDALIARRAVEFVAREDAALRGLRLFNTYEWGGYLGWRRPREKVFGDGRYLFHGQIPELERALRSAAELEAFAARHRLDGFLIKNYPNRLPTVRRYPDGSERPFLRPWHLFLLPRERWALVYFDEQALLFVDRAKVPKRWLAAHEYRWLRPGDGEALADALSRGEVPREAVEAEAARRAQEADSGNARNSAR